MANPGENSQHSEGTHDENEASTSAEVSISQKEEVSENGEQNATTSTVEFSKHPWDEFYKQAENRVHPESGGEFELEKVIDKYTISQAHDFRQQTLSSFRNRADYQPNDAFTDKHRRPEYLVTWRKSNGIPDGIFAYFRVFSSTATQSFLTPVHREIFAPDRGDLRLITLDATSFDRLNAEKSAVGSLFDGDILAVFNIRLIDATIARLPEIHPNDATIHDGGTYRPVWCVAEFCVMPRHVIRDTPITCYQDAMSLRFDPISNKPLVRMVASGLSRTICAPIDMFPFKPVEDNLFVADIFDPISQRDADRFCANLAGPSARHHLHSFASDLTKFRPAGPAIINVREVSDEIMGIFNQGRQLFGVFDEEKAVSALKMIMKWAASAEAAIRNDDYDPNTYHVRLNLEENTGEDQDSYVSFNLTRTDEPLEQSQWQPNITLNIVLPSTYVTGTVYNTVMDENVLTVTARIPKQHARRFRRELFSAAGGGDSFLSEAIVSQEIQSMESDKIFQTLVQTNIDFPPNSPSRRIVRAIFGGRPIRWRWQNRIVYVADNYPDVIELSEGQNDYINGFLSNPPALIGNSPFGGGKTTTMAVAALEACRLDNGVQMLVGITNSSVANLVRTTGKLRMPESPNYIRLISRKNYLQIEEECKTAYDTPVLLDETFRDFVLKYNHRQNRGNSEKEAMLRVAVDYCSRNRLLNAEDIENSATRDLFQQLYDTPPCDINQKSYISTFIRLYRPQIIFCTIATAISLIPTTWSELNQSDQIEAIQIDETSQLPLTALVALLSKFPNARIAMIGDYRQLPPFSHLRNTPMIGQFAIGNVLEDAVVERWLPCAQFRKVYRCHPIITYILGREFYDNQIDPVESRETSSYFIRRAAWWPNKSFPIAFLDHTAPFVPAGTSSYNTDELHLANTLLQRISTVIQERHVACVCFYRAQADRLLADNIASPALIGTVDSHQGQEREVVVICTTRSSGRISQFLSDSRRINVAMSRARQAFIVIGCLENLRNAAGWSGIIRDIERERNVIYERDLFEQTD